MKTIHFAFGMILGIPSLFSQGVVPLANDQEIKVHFNKRVPQLFRYGGLAKYGDSIAQNIPSESLISEQVELANRLMGSALIEKPTDLVFALCHDLVINKPSEGIKLLTALSKIPYPSEHEKLLCVCFLAAGSSGESILVDMLTSNDSKWAQFSANLLESYALDDETAQKVAALLKLSTNNQLKCTYMKILTQIGYSNAHSTIESIAITTTDDGTQAFALFSITELLGHDAIPFLGTIKAVGPKSSKELSNSISWLKNDTSRSNPHGLEVTNDTDFINRFSDLPTPSLDWLKLRGLLKASRISRPTRLGPEETGQLLNVLIQSKCFGLEVCKAELLLSLTPVHKNALRQLAAVNWYSPYQATSRRSNSLSILMRSIRYNEFATFK